MCIPLVTTQKMKDHGLFRGIEALRLLIEHFEKCFPVKGMRILRKELKTCSFWKTFHAEMFVRLCITLTIIISCVDITVSDFRRNKKNRYKLLK